MGLAFRSTFLLCSAFWHVSHILIWRGKRGIKRTGELADGSCQTQDCTGCGGVRHTAGLSSFLSPNKKEEVQEKRGQNTTG